MRVKELAVDLKVSPDLLLRFLRDSGVRVGHPDAPLADADVARVRTRLERERRAGRGSAAEVMKATAKASKPTSRRRRTPRRRTRKAPAKEAVEAAAPSATTTPEATAPDKAPPPPQEDVAAPAPEAQPTDPAPTVVAERPAAAARSPRGEEAPRPSEAPVAEASQPTETQPGAFQPGTSQPGEPQSRDPQPTDTHPAASQPTEAEAPAVPGPPAAEQPAARPVASARPETLAGSPPGRPAPAREGGPAKPARVADGVGPAASAGPGGRVRIQAEGYTSDGRRKQKRKKGRRRPAPDRHAAKENVQRVLAEIKGGKKRTRKGKAALATEKEQRAVQEQRAAEVEAVEAKTVRVNEYLTVAELAELIKVAPTEIVGSAFRNMGLMVTINQRLDFDQIELLLEGFGFVAVRESDYMPTPEPEEEDDPADLCPRPPVVTVMGHVDHGKTRLLDWIRSANVVAGEAGGITQHIGAYHVEVNGGRTISFLDTPGHAAFTAMRARGAELTDLVVLVVAADDAVMPQTVEAISHAKNAGVPMVVAVNKVDLPTADPARVKQTLLQHGVTVEEFGGDAMVAEVSAKTGQGMDDLLEKILLQAELLELAANPSRDAKGIIVEAELDVGKGPLATVLVQRGTLRVGDSFVAGLHDGRVRALLDERGKAVDGAGPGIPVQILGCSGIPRAGDAFQVMDSVAAASIANARQRLDREKQLRIKGQGIRLGDFSQLLASGKTGVLRVVIKGDVDGSVQALADSLEQLSTDEVRVEIVHRGVGAVNESDVMLALAAGAVIIGFRVRPDTGSRQSAAREKVDIRLYDVIYEAVDDVKAALEGLLAPERRESVVGVAEARVIFKIKGVGTIAGSYITEGVMHRNGQARVVRDGIVVYEGEVASLKRFKEDVREVREGFECGIGIANFNDVKAGDVIETYEVEEVARTLAAAGQG